MKGAWAPEAGAETGTGAEAATGTQAGWRNVARRPNSAIFILGLISACGFQPLGLWPLALIALAGAMALLAQCASWRAAMWQGWLFGLGHFALGNNWIATAFGYQAGMPPALGWVAVVMLATYLALYPALVAAIVHVVARRTGIEAAGWRWILLFGAVWIVAEWLRGWAFTGYPWNPYGIVLLGGFDQPGLARFAPWLGTYGLSGLVVLMAGAGLVLVRQRQPVWALVLAGGVGAGMAWPASPAVQGDLPYTLVQPDVRQEHINDPALFEEQFARTAGLSRPHSSGAKRLVLWPESGVPDYLRDGYPERYYRQMTAMADPAFARARIGRAIGPDSLLLTGAVDLEIADDRAVGARNAVTAIDGAGQIRAGYAKAHLVPFGEYLALRQLLEPLGVARFVTGNIDFWPGPGPRTLDLGPWGRAGIQICYEIIFSGAVVQRGVRPDYIVNPSNDGWFGAWGPPQHLAQARLRAIEEGLPVLRATTTGISAVIDPRGVVVRHVPRHVAGRLDGFVPRALPPTAFARLGNGLPLAWAMLLIFISLVARRRAAR